MGKAIFITGLVVGVIHLGPFFGALLGGGVSLVIALPAEAIWRRSRRAGWLDSARKRRLVTATACLCFGIPLYVLLTPPSGRALLREHLHLSSGSVHDVRRWANTWSIDPTYGVRFRADPAALRDACEFLVPATTSRASAVAALPSPSTTVTPSSSAAEPCSAAIADLPSATPPADVLWMLQPVFGRPSWWKPEELPGGQKWTSPGSLNPELRLLCDPETGEGYLVIAYF